MEHDDLLRQDAEQAGVLPEEMTQHPTLGLVVSASGLRKMLALLPDGQRKMGMLEVLQHVAPTPGET